MSEKIKNSAESPAGKSRRDFMNLIGTAGLGAILLGNVGCNKLEGVRFGEGEILCRYPSSLRNNPTHYNQANEEGYEPATEPIGNQFTRLQGQPNRGLVSIRTQIPDLGCEKAKFKRIVTAVALMPGGVRESVNIFNPSSDVIGTAIIINDGTDSGHTFFDEYEVEVNNRGICDAVEFTVELQIDKDASEGNNNTDWATIDTSRFLVNAR